MKSINKYNQYIFISTFTRNIIDIYSIIYLYKQQFTLKEIIAIYSLCYFLGCFISHISIIIGNAVGYKYILSISSVITSITFYIIHNIHNIYIISIFLSLSMFTYHPIRHLYGINFLKHKKTVGKNLIYIYIATLLSSYFAITNINIIYLILITIAGIIPCLLIEDNKYKKITYPQRIPHTKILFFIFDQFKIIFLLLEPLYLYLIINNISFVGYFNILLTISSIICIYILTNKIDIYQYYKYINIIFTLILIIKLNILATTPLLILALFEGIGIKTNELVSTINLYYYNHNLEGYIIISEYIFCITRVLILCTTYFLNLNLKIILYILIIGILILSFQYKKNTLT